MIYTATYEILWWKSQMHSVENKRVIQITDEKPFIKKSFYVSLFTWALEAVITWPRLPRLLV